MDEQRHRDPGEDPEPVPVVDREAQARARRRQQGGQPSGRKRAREEAADERDARGRDDREREPVDPRAQPSGARGEHDEHVDPQVERGPVELDDRVLGTRRPRRREHAPARERREQQPRHARPRAATAPVARPRAAARPGSSTRRAARACFGLPASSRRRRRRRRTSRPRRPPPSPRREPKPARSTARLNEPRLSSPERGSGEHEQDRGQRRDEQQHLRPGANGRPGSRPAARARHSSRRTGSRPRSSAGRRQPWARAHRTAGRGGRAGSRARTGATSPSQPGTRARSGPFPFGGTRAEKIPAGPACSRATTSQDDASRCSTTTAPARLVGVRPQTEIRLPGRIGDEREPERRQRGLRAVVRRTSSPGSRAPTGTGSSRAAGRGA